MHDEGVHGPGLGAEARRTIAAGFGGAEFELEEGRVARVDDGKIVGHVFLSHLQLGAGSRRYSGRHER